MLVGLVTVWDCFINIESMVFKHRLHVYLRRLSQGNFIETPFKAVFN
jgi:hypothetical protein